MTSGSFRYEKTPPPKGFRDVPRYLRELLGGFFFRLFYIFRLVWKTDPWILTILLGISILTGLIPVASSYVTARVLNELQVLIEASFGVGVENKLDYFLGSPIFYALVFFFVLKVLQRVTGRISTAVTRIAGEKVVRHVRVMIMTKSKELDLAAFDIPEFYEKLENANREAGNRPITILHSSFSVISTLISLISYIVILSAALPIATLCIMAVSIPGAIINFYYRRKNFEYMRRRSKDRRQMDYYSSVVVNKDLVKEVRIYKLTDLFIARYKEVFARYFKGLRRLIVRENVLHIIVSVAASVINLIFFGILAYRVIFENLMIGNYTLLTGAITSIATDVSTLITTSASIFEGTLFIDNLISYMKQKPTVVSSLKEPAKIN